MFDEGEIIGGPLKWADEVKEGRLKVAEGLNRMMVLTRKDLRVISG